MTKHITVALVAATLVSAAPGDGSTSDELVRRGNEALTRGDADGADRLYAAAEERTDDPGLVAFNRAAVLFVRGDFREAERLYQRTLADDAIPPDRRARALFNRGVCLLKRGGDADAFRSAVECFEQCLDVPPADPALAADARHNLEIAKVLWGRERAKEQTPPKANDKSPDETVPRPKPAKGTTDGDPSVTRNDPTARPDPSAKPQPATGPNPTDRAPLPTDRRTPGAGNLPVILDTDAPQPLSPDDTRALLRRAAERLEKDRKATARMLAGPERPDVRDW